MSSATLNRRSTSPAPRSNGHPTGVPSAGGGGPGRYRYVPDAGWWWSAEMFLLHGMAPDSVQPSLDLLLRHQHPEDRPRTLAALADARRLGRPFCLEVRLRAAQAPERTVVLVGEPEADPAGTVTAVTGLAAELTHGPAGNDRKALLAQIAQLRAAMVSRAAIEQAKGIVMLLTGCAEDAAFDVLTFISSNTHRKVRDVAVALTESACGRSRLPDDMATILRDACPPTVRLR